MAQFVRNLAEKAPALVNGERGRQPAGTGSRAGAGEACEGRRRGLERPEGAAAGRA